MKLDFMFFKHTCITCIVGLKSSDLSHADGSCVFLGRFEKPLELLDSDGRTTSQRLCSSMARQEAEVLGIIVLLI